MTQQWLSHKIETKTQQQLYFGQQNQLNVHFFLNTYVNGSWQIKLELRADAYRNMQVNLDFILKSKVCIYALLGGNSANQECR